jgi:hypothetical protein
VRECYKFSKDNTLIKLPSPNTYMKNQNHKNKLRIPFIVYADCECTLQATNGPKQIHKHIPNSCCYYFVCSFDNSRNELKEFVGDNCIVDMIKSLITLSKACIKEMKQNATMIFGKQEADKFKRETTCYICNFTFTQKRSTLIG